MENTPKELGIGSWGDIVTIHIDTPLHDALETFLRNRVSALPLVDEKGRVSFGRVAYWQNSTTRRGD